MTALRAIFNYEADGIWLRRELLGTSHSFERDGRRVTITFPRDETDLQTYQLREGEFHLATAGGAGTVDDPKQALGVLIFRVEVYIEGDVSAAEFDEPDEDNTLAKRATAIFDEAAKIGDAAVRDVLASIRALHSQSWLGLSTMPPRREGIASLVEVATERRLPIGPTMSIGAQLKSIESALTPEQFAEIMSRLERGEAAPIAETLLADAEYLAWGVHAAPDALRAVLMAAIACEIKVKENLRSRIDDDKLPLLDFILENPREVTVTAADGLFNTLMLVAQGRSLRTDNRDLFKKVVELFEVRNRVAHRGEWPDAEKARELVRAARSAFSWLDQTGTPAS